MMVLRLSIRPSGPASSVANPDGHPGGRSFLYNSEWLATENRGGKVHPSCYICETPLRRSTDEPIPIQSINGHVCRPCIDRLQELHGIPYRDYLTTDWWAEQREKALGRANFSCQLCNDTRRLQVHHRTYRRLGMEEPGDLIVLCADCHETFHKNRKLA